MAQSHAALRAMLARQVGDQRTAPSEWLLSPHPSPLPLVPLSHRRGEGLGVRATGEWGEGESFAALLSDRIALNGRSAAMANGASEVQNASATIPSPGGRGSGLRREKAASAPQAG